MVEPKYVQPYGNQLAIIMGDGTKRLAYPTHTEVWIVTGGGEGPPPVGGDYSWPFDPDNDVTSEYGPRWGRFHEGIDFGMGTALDGADIFAAGAGTVQTSGWHAAFGNHVIIHHGTIGSYDYKTLYAHMKFASGLSVNDPVAKGQLVGVVGNTGASEGSHLHWETHQCAIGGGIIWNTDDNSNPRTAINPRDFMAAHGDGLILND